METKGGQENGAGQDRSTEAGSDRGCATSTLASVVHGAQIELGLGVTLVGKLSKYS